MPRFRYLGKSRTCRWAAEREYFIRRRFERSSGRGKMEFDANIEAAVISPNPGCVNFCVPLFVFILFRLCLIFPIVKCRRAIGTLHSSPPLSFTPAGSFSGWLGVDFLESAFSPDTSFKCKSYSVQLSLLIFGAGFWGQDTHKQYRFRIMRDRNAEGAVHRLFQPDKNQRRLVYRG